MKKCTKCFQDLELSLFYFDRSQNRFKSQCRKCILSTKKRVDKKTSNYIERRRIYSMKRKTPFSKEWLQRRFYASKVNCIKSGREFSISFSEYKDYLKVEKCYYCSEIPEIKSIDRLNNSLGYINSNCVMACLKCNLLKGKMTKQDVPRVKKIISKLV